jgi:hypothetical protein
MPDMVRSTRFYTLAAVVTTIGLVAACASDPLAPGEIEAKKASTQGAGGSPWSSPSEHGLLKCTPQPYAADSAWIGPEGGTIKIGKNKFTVPEGALTQPTLITMELPSDTVVSARFSPEGLTFHADARPKLKLDYKSCGKVKGKVSIVYTTEDLDVLQVLPSQQGDQDGDSENDDVDSDLDHFSRYAVYY